MYEGGIKLYYVKAQSIFSEFAGGILVLNFVIRGYIFPHISLRFSIFICVCVRLCVYVYVCVCELVKCMSLSLLKKNKYK